MTRRDQTLRAWIERQSPRHNWISCISSDGAAHRKTTHSRNRKAAREFNRLHTIEILYPTPITPPTPHHQTELFHR